MKCDACEIENGVFTSGVKGILARVEDGKIKSKVQRCDNCETYPTDAVAKQVLLRLLEGKIHQVTVLVEKRDLRKQIKELGKYLDQNSGHLELPRLKAFEHIMVLLTTINMGLKGAKSVKAPARKTH